MENLYIFLNNNLLICPEINEISLLHRGFWYIEDTRENVALFAGKHASATRSWKVVVKGKVKAVEQSIDVVDPDKKGIAHVMDYYQILDLPNLGGKQSRDTCY